MKQPFNEDAEEAVLGAMLSAPRAVMAAHDAGLQPDHFYRQRHGLICKAIFEIDSKGEQPDTITVGRLLREWGKLDEAGGMPVLNTLVSTVPSIANAALHAGVVIDVAAERGLHQAALRIAELAEGEGAATEKLAEAERIVAEVSNSQVGEFERIGAQTTGAFEEITRAVETGQERVGMKTGFTKLDELTKGFFPGQLIILAARPGQGKSTLAQNIAEWVAGKRQTVAIFSLEMGAEEIGLRMVSSLSRVEHDKIVTGRMDQKEWLKVKQAKNDLEALPIYTVDGTVSATELRARTRRLKRQVGLDLLIVDYLQLLTGSSRRRDDSRNEEVSEISRGLKLLARELEIPVLALSQLNRGVEQRQNKRPMLADLRDSGAIEQDADIVAFIYRDDYYNPESEKPGEAEIIVAKQRSGATGTVTLTFLGGRCKFSNLASASDRQAAATGSGADVPW